jgi:hypothetical protein
MAAAIHVGDLCYIDYGEGPPQVIHTRLVVGFIDELEYMIVTPDRDCYVEVLDISNPDAVQFWVGRPNGALPQGVAAAAVYGFGNLTAAQFNALLARGRALTTAELNRRGLQPGGGGAPAVAAPPGLGGAAGAAPAPGGGQNPPAGGPALANARRWVLAEMVDGHLIGEEVTFPAGGTHDGEWGLVTLPGMVNPRPVLVKQIDLATELDAFCEERIRLARASLAAAGSDTAVGDDVRTLSVHYAADGSRSRTFKGSVAEMFEVDFEGSPLRRAPASRTAGRSPSLRSAAWLST